MIAALVITIALFAGLLARVVSLPPMIGFLAVGFLIPLYPPFADINFTQIAELGVTLLLFSIGLKLNLRSLIKPQIWGVTTLHMGLTIVLMTAVLVLLKASGWMLLHDLDNTQLATIGFALSFSSTIFAVKVLEDRGEMASLHGSITIGILVMQDLIAVLYLTITGDKTPAIYAPLVLLAIPLRHCLQRFLAFCGHGELLVLAGFSMALGGAMLFESVGLKGDLGALFLGAVLAGDNKANELTKALLNFKDLLLVGFFLSIGQYGLPSSDAWIMAFILALLLIAKPLFYFLLLSRFQVRARSAFFSAMTLNNYSEFGLIVMAIASHNGLLPDQWTVIIALALSLSYISSSISMNKSDEMFARIGVMLHKFQTQKPLPKPKPINIGDATFIVMGMGRVGTGAYDYLQETYGETIAGFDENIEKVSGHCDKQRNVTLGDAREAQLWYRLPLDKVEHILLALSNHTETLEVAKLIRKKGYQGTISATAKYADEVDQLRGLDVIAFNLYAEAGAGFAEHVHHQLETRNAQT